MVLVRSRCDRLGCAVVRCRLRAGAVAARVALVSARLVTIADMLAAEISHRDQGRAHELLARCLRLEAKIVALECERARAWPARPLRRPYRVVRPADAAQMRALRQSGLAVQDIADQLHWSNPTVRRYTTGVLVERAVGQ
jgi:hypothetical protein